MKTLTSLGVLVLIWLLVGVAAPTQAAPSAKGGFSVKVDHTTLHGGQTLTATGRSATSCAWVVDWNDEHRSTTGKRIVATFVAPEVTTVTRIPLRATCFSASSALPRPTPPPPPVLPNSVTQRITVTVPGNVHQTIIVTVLPSGAIVSPPSPGNGGDPGGDGDLPNTGGPDLWTLLAGIATLLAGISMIRLATSAEPSFPMD